MKYKKRAAGMLFLSAIIIVVLTGCKANPGSEASSDYSVTESANKISNPDAAADNIDIEKVGDVISDTDNNVFEGNIGTQNICMAIYREGEQLTASFVTQNEDDGEIMLQGTIQTGTASFTLRSEDNTIAFTGTTKPDTAEGELLEGICTYAENEEETPFALTLTHGIGQTYDTRYPLITAKTKEIEEFAGKIKSYVIENNKKGLAELINYPINVTIKGSKVSISNTEEFEQNYDDIMNNEFKERISKSYTKYMFSNYMGIMIGNGDIWFDYWADKGLQIYAINN